MAGEFFLPNYGAPQQTGSYGLGYNTNYAFNVPQPSMTPDQLRFTQLNQQMQPNNTLGYIGAGIQGFNTLGSLVLGWRAMQQAQQASQWQQNMAEKNYWNSVKSYDTAMADKVSSRYAGTPGATEEINRRKLGPDVPASPFHSISKYGSY